jgi:hypothetical protein
MVPKKMEKNAKKSQGCELPTEGCAGSRQIPCASQPRPASRGMVANRVSRNRGLRIGAVLSPAWNLGRIFLDARGALCSSLTLGDSPVNRAQRLRSCNLQTLVIKPGDQSRQSTLKSGLLVSLLETTTVQIDGGMDKLIKSNLWGSLWLC